MDNPHYDILVIGGGQAGVPLAHALAKKDRRVALAERKYLGGTCVNYGCTPTKAVVASARVAHLARRAEEFGLRIPTVEVELPAVLERAKQILMQSRTSLQQGFEKADNPVLLRGHARFQGKRDGRFQLRVDKQDVTADQVVLNVGARTHLPPVEGLDKANYLHAGNWLEHTELPSHLAVIGGGYIGLEMGQFYRRMGSQVTVIQSRGEIAPNEDEDVAKTLRHLLQAEGIGFRLNSRARRVEAVRGVTVTLEGDDQRAIKIEASHLFVATGRRPNTGDLGLETVGVDLDKKGFIQANERLATSVKGIWAAGDARGGPMFTHTAWDDHRVLLAQLTDDEPKTTKRVVPYAIFTDPELGRVGMTEREARKTKKNIKVARFDMNKSGKANEIGQTEGFIKVVVDADSSEILGAAVLAAEGAELVHVYIDLMNAGAPYTVIRDAVHIHPTLAEALQSVFASLE